MSAPHFFDFSAGQDLTEGVRRLRQLTSAEHYTCSLGDYLDKGWKGESCKLSMDSGFVYVHPSAYCPRFTVWALPKEEVSLEQKRDELKAVRAALVEALLRFDSLNLVDP